jgi:hypothetical protein
VKKKRKFGLRHIYLRREKGIGAYEQLGVELQDRVVACYTKIFPSNISSSRIQPE